MKNFNYLSKYFVYKVKNWINYIIINKYNNWNDNGSYHNKYPYKYSTN